MNEIDKTICKMNSVKKMAVISLICNAVLESADSDGQVNGGDLVERLLEILSSFDINPLDRQ